MRVDSLDSAVNQLTSGVDLNIDSRDGVKWTLRVDITGEVNACHSELMRASLAYFARHALGMEVSSLHLDWSETVARSKRLSLLAARDHGKSAFWSYAYPIWQAWRNPGSLGYIISCQSLLAEELLAIIREGNSTLKGLVDHPFLGHLVDEKKNWSKRQIRLLNGSVIRARGFGSRMRGGHPGWIVCDDALDESHVYSSMAREKSKKFFRAGITNMVLKGGQIIVVGTPFHADDLYADLRGNKVYTSKTYSGLIEDPEAPLSSDGKRWRALYPERHSVEDLLDKREEIGAVDFAREILCQPITDDLTLFPSDLFTGDVLQPLIGFGPTLREIDEQRWNVFVGVDLAISASSGADYTVITVLAEDWNGNKIVIDCSRVQGMGFQDQLAEILRINAQYQPSLIVIESNQMQRIWGDELIRTSDAPVKKFHTSEKKNSLTEGVPSLRVLLENGKLRFARGCERSREATDLYMEELQSFGFVGGKVRGIGAHDDCVMSLWLAVQATKLGGFKFSVNDGDRAPRSEQNRPTSVGGHSAEDLDKASIWGQFGLH